MRDQSSLKASRTDARFKVQSEQPDVVVLAVTSHLVGEGPQVFRLSPDEQRAAGLPKPSLVKVDKVLTLEQTLVLRRLGALPRESTQRLMRKFQYFFAS